ncbi:MAG: hypothetical protein WB565_00175 [Acidimicrobiales bacterium]
MKTIRKVTLGVAHLTRRAKNFATGSVRGAVSGLAVLAATSFSLSLLVHPAAAASAADHNATQRVPVNPYTPTNDIHSTCVQYGLDVFDTVSGINPNLGILYTATFNTPDGSLVDRFSAQRGTTQDIGVDYQPYGTVATYSGVITDDLSPSDSWPIPAVTITVTCNSTSASQCAGSASDPIVGLAPSYNHIHQNNGYWKVGAQGGVTGCGGAVDYGSMAGYPLNQPINGMASTPDGGGYWLVASDGGIFAFGDAGFYGSMGSTHLNQPVISMAATPDNRGYWLVASDGGIFAFGDAAFYGSTGSMVLNQPVVGMSPTPDGGGYWLVASDGGIFAFGDAGFYGSMGGTHLNQPVVGMVSSTDGHGYLLVAADGGVFAFGDAPFNGSTGSNPPPTPVIGVVSDGQGGYWLVDNQGDTYAFGGAPYYG